MPRSAPRRGRSVPSSRSDLDLDGGVAARIEDLSRADSLDTASQVGPPGKPGRAGTAYPRRCARYGNVSGRTLSAMRRPEPPLASASAPLATAAVAAQARCRPRLRRQHRPGRARGRTGHGRGSGRPHPLADRHRRSGTPHGRGRTMTPCPCSTWCSTVGDCSIRPSWIQRTGQIGHAGGRADLVVHHAHRLAPQPRGAASCRRSSGQARRRTHAVRTTQVPVGQFAAQPLRSLASFVRP